MRYRTRRSSSTRTEASARGCTQVSESGNRRQWWQPAFTAGLRQLRCFWHFRRTIEGTLYSVDFASGLYRQTRKKATRLKVKRRALSLDYFERGRPSCAEVRSHEIPDDKEPGWIIPEELRDRWEYYSGRERAALPTLMEDVSDIGLFYHDSDHRRPVCYSNLNSRSISYSPAELSSHHTSIATKRLTSSSTSAECDHGVLHYDYLYSDEYDVPCSCGYVIK